MNNLSYPNFKEIIPSQLKKEHPDISKIVDELSKKGNIVFCESNSFTLYNLTFDSRKRHFHDLDKFYKIFESNVLYFISSIKFFKGPNIVKHNTFEVIYCRCLDVSVFKKFKLDKLIQSTKK